ncbi:MULTISPECIES: META domain-containing protein [Acetobacter]|uniref:META domain-containing protein n=1 Tax=Acetobacter TaxID=434 RepID=UPI000A385901|nr:MULTISPECIES: META domain-containing protein [Acetobacter]MBS0986824.1 META domain-containing protein [Acetobacter thailandicus]
MIRKTKTVFTTSYRHMLMGGLSLSLPLLTGGCSLFHKSSPAVPQSVQNSDDVYQAAGSSPDWHLTLSGNTLTFNRQGAPTQIKTLTEDESDSAHRTYLTKKMKVDVTPQTCTNSTTGQTYSETVTVKTPQGTYHGCGGDPARAAIINGTSWVVTALNGTPVTAGNDRPSLTDATTDMAPDVQQTPTLNINATGDVSGSDGCNRYSGGMTVRPEGRIIHQQSGMNTLMACSGAIMQRADIFNGLLRAATSWQASGSTLTLKTDDDRTIQLRQIL